MLAPTIFPNKTRKPLSTYGEQIVNGHFIRDIVYNDAPFSPSDLYLIAYTAYLLSEDAGTCQHFRELMDYYRSIK